MEKALEQKVQNTTHLGWQDDGTFLPGSSTYRLINEQDTFDLSDRTTPRGTLGNWKRLAEKARRSPGARLVLAASFATSLLKLEECRTFGIHFWGPNQDGLRAAFKLGASVWMNPWYSEDFGLPKKWMESALPFYANLPAFVYPRRMTEKTVTEVLFDVVKKEGQTYSPKHRTIIMTADEFPLKTRFSIGEKNSCFLELHFERMVDEFQYASELERRSDLNYGTAGPMFIEQLQHHRVYDTEEYWWEQLKGKKVNDTHRAYLTIIATADQLSSEYIWGQSNETASGETKHFLDSWIQALQVSYKRDREYGPYSFWVGVKRPVITKIRSVNSYRYVV